MESEGLVIDEKMYDAVCYERDNLEVQYNILKDKFEKLEALANEAKDYMDHNSNRCTYHASCNCGLKEWYKKAKEILG